MSGNGTFGGTVLRVFTISSAFWFLSFSVATAQAPSNEPTVEDFFHAIAVRDTNAAARMLESDTNLSRAAYNLSKLPLLEAAAAGNVQLMKRLVELGVNLNAAGDTLTSAGAQFTALHVAIRHNQLATCRWLLESGANPNLMAFGFATPLHLAFTFAEPREEMAGWLLEFGADPFLEKRFVNDHTTPFEAAITHGSGRLVPRMLGFRPSVRGEAVRQGNELKSGELLPDPRVVRLLATNGPALLAVAAQRGGLEAVEALLNVGVKPPSRLSNGYSPLQVIALSVAAAERRRDFDAERWGKIRELLESAGARCDALAATGFGDLETARRLLAADMNTVNERDLEGGTPLHWAVSTDRLPFTSFWLEAGAAPGATNQAGQTALHLAAARGLTAHVQRLLAANAPANARDTNGWTPLDAAMQADQTETIRLLLASTKGPPLDRGIATTIHEAAASGNIVALTEFATPKNLEARNELGLTPLHLAAQRGQLGAAAFLLDKGANVKARDPQGNTVLHLILLSRTQWIAGRPSNSWVERQRQDPQKERFLRLLDSTNEIHSANHVAEAVAFFLAGGADATLKNHQGLTALQLAMNEDSVISSDGRMALMPLFSQGKDGLDALDENGETELHRAAREHLGDRVEALVAAGADLNATNKAGRTPLHLSVENLGSWGDSQPFAVILRAKPNLNAQDHEGLTALHLLLLSESSVQDEATEALLNAGANPNLRDKRDRTPLLCALAGKWPWEAADASLGQLVTAGAKTDVADDHGDSALHYLARMGEQKPMFFIPGVADQFGSLDVNATNRAGDTPLHVAARSGTSDVFDWLRSRGARLDVTNAAGKTPQQLASRNSSPFARLNFGLPAELARAAQQGELETLDRALRSDTSLLNATNTAGETVLRIAARSGQTNLAAALLQQGAEWDAVSATLLGRADMLRDLLARKPTALTNSSLGKQLIHLAAESGDVTILEILLSAGADVEARARSGLSPLGIALLNKQNAAVAMLRARGASENIFDAVVVDLPDQAAAMLALKPSLGRAANQFEFTPAHLAAALERRAILKILLDYQVPPGILAGSTWISPLHVAAACNRTNAIALLVERGARTEVTDDSGCTPLHYVAARGATESAAVLLALGAKPDTQASSMGSRMPFPSGNTALHFAVSAGRTNIVALLLQAGANVNATNALGLTPLDLTRPGMPISPPWNGPSSSPGFKLAASFRSMGLPQLTNFTSILPAQFSSPNDSALAAMLERAGGVYGTASPGWRPR